MTCRICNNKLNKILDLGKIGLIGIFSKKKTKSKKFKISLHFCSFCKHLQIKEKINPNKIFRNYLWETGVSKTNMFLINDLINNLINKLRIKKKLKVFEIACNDGLFLDLIKKKTGCVAVGIDPAKNLAKKQKSFKRIINYFDNKISFQIKKEYGTFNCIVARNVLAHVKNPNEIFKGVKNIIDKNGVFILEFPSLLNIIKYNQYDNIFHEHIGFHSLKSIKDLCEINNFKLIKFEKLNSQGGSLRCYITTKNNLISVSKSISNFINLEKKNGLFSDKKLLDFKNCINNHRQNLNNFIKNLSKRYKKISAYGASGKGIALLQYSKINNNLIKVVYDKSKLKQNKYIGATNMLVKAPSNIKKDGVDLLLLLSWNLKEEIIKQEQKFIYSGGKFIIPFPKPKLI